MDENKVAHIDLKADNILLTRRSRPLRLLIIDFSVSLWVDTEESWVEGYRGTKGWAAPGLQDDKYQSIRADLWSTGRVLQYIAHSQHVNTNSPSPFKRNSLATKLLHRNPLGRRLLSNIDLYHENPPRLQLKRKWDVDEQEENEVERRSPVGPQSGLWSFDVDVREEPVRLPRQAVVRLNSSFLYTTTSDITQAKNECPQSERTHSDNALCPQTQQHSHQYSAPCVNKVGLHFRLSEVDACHDSIHYTASTPLTGRRRP